MATPPRFRNYPWLRTPLRTKAGELRLAGAVEDVPALDPDAMRVLGSYSLVFMLEVDGFYVDAHGLRRDLRPGDAITVLPDLAHAYGPKTGRSWRQIYVVFDGPIFELLRESGVLSAARPVWHLEPVDYWRRRLEEVFHLEDGTNGTTETTAMRALGRFVHLLTDMAATSAEAVRPASEQWLEDALQRLARRGPRGWPTPQTVAREVGLSYENFRKQFARRTGESPGQYQKRRRIDHACAAIYQGSHGFKELADELGFCDVFHFSKAFRQVVGETPSAFRKKVHGR
jgi:AraC-like DNA-binding protein